MRERRESFPQRAQETQIHLHVFTPISKAQANEIPHLRGNLNVLCRLSPVPHLQFVLQRGNMRVERNQHLFAWQGVQKGESCVETGRVVWLRSVPELFEQTVKLSSASSGNGIDHFCAVARLLGGLQGDKTFGGEFFEGIMDRTRQYCRPLLGPVEA